MSLQTDWMIIHLCLQVSGNEVRSRLTGLSPQWTVAHIIYICIYMILSKGTGQFNMMQFFLGTWRTLYHAFK